MSRKLSSMQAAIDQYVSNGDLLVAEGFTHLIPFAAGHEIIRQHKRDLVLCRLTPDLIFDQMVAAGVARKLIFGWIGNPGVGSLHGIRRAVERGIPSSIEIEEYSHFGLLSRLQAGAAGLPFQPVRNYYGTDLLRVNSQIQSIICPFTGQEVYAVPALRPDVAIIHAQRSDTEGNTQVWGLTGVQKEAAFAARKVIVIVEELVDETVIRSDPNRTLIPGLIVNAIVHEPFGAHPSYAQGFYDRDNEFYLEWDRRSRTVDGMNAYLDEWVYGIPDRATYKKKCGEKMLARLRPVPSPSSSVNYGSYR